MEPHDRTISDRNTKDPSDKEVTENTTDDSLSEESKGISNDSIKEAETNQSTLSLRNLRPSRKNTLLERANTKYENSLKVSKRDIGSGFPDKSRKDLIDKISDAKQFFDGENPYSAHPDPLSQIEDKCRISNPDTSLLESVKNSLFGTPFDGIYNVLSFTGQTTIVAAGVESAITGRAMLKILTSGSPVGMAIGLTVAIALKAKDINDQHKHDKEKAISGKIRCERDLMKEFIIKNSKN